MTVECLGFCDFAQDNSGKLAVLGMFDTVFSKSFPVIHPQMAFALKIRFSISEKGTHEVKINFNSKNGKNNFPGIEATANVTSFSSATATAQFINYFLQTKFESEDTIVANVQVDGKEICSTPLYLKRIS